MLQSMGSQSQIQLSAELTDWEVSEGEDRQRYSYKQSLDNDWSSLVAQTIKNLPTMRETRVQSLGGEDPLEKEMATHSSILAWKVPWTEEPGGLQSMGSQRVDTTEVN